MSFTRPRQQHCIYHTLQFWQRLTRSWACCAALLTAGEVDLDHPNLEIRYCRETRSTTWLQGLFFNPFTTGRLAGRRQFKPDVIQAELLWTAPAACGCAAAPACRSS